MDKAMSALESFRNNISQYRLRLRSNPHPIEIDTRAQSPFTTTGHLSYVSSTTTEIPLHQSKIRRMADKPRSLMFGDVNMFGRPDARWKKWVALGLPLDIFAKFILVLTMHEAMLAIVIGLDGFVRHQHFNTHFWNLFYGALCGWGVCLGLMSLLGFLILWGRWRKSIVAVRIFSVINAFYSVLFFASAVVWLTWASRSTPKMRQNCTARPFFNINGELFPFPPWLIAFCLNSASVYQGWQIIWGIINLIQIYWALIMVIWCQDFETRLRQRQAWSNGAVRDSYGSMNEKGWGLEIQNAKTINITKGAVMRVVGRVPVDDSVLDKPSIGTAMMTQTRILSATSFPMRISGAIPIGLDLGNMTPSTFGLPPARLAPPRHLKSQLSFSYNQI